MVLELLSEKPLMCYIIFKGVKYYSETETGIDFTTNSRGSSENQEECFNNNLEQGKDSVETLTGKGKLFS